MGRKIYQVRQIMIECLNNEPRNLVTRETGKIVRRAIENRIGKEPEGTVVVLDFCHVGIIDFSCADEIIAKLVARLNSQEYGDKFIILKELSHNQEENINVAMERKRLAILSFKEGGGWRILGILNPYLTEALNYVMERGTITARELADITQAEISAASTKLINLHKLRLVLRESENLPERGRQFVYRALIYEI